jgi:hypothetical protein
LALVFRDLEEHNADFDALQRLEADDERFSRPELEELRALFGLYGLETARRLPGHEQDVAHIAARQQVWRQVRVQDRSPVRTEVADRAVARYGLILAELTEPGPAG